MANPQPEKGYIRIANELWNELLRRDFSKRQLNLILFIWRLSYGTGQKECLVEKFNSFEIAGIYKADIKKELKFLRECAVLNWDEETMIFSINKNYHLWQITPSKNWDSEKFDSLIHQNLSRKKVSKIPTKNKRSVGKTLTYKSKKVSKTLTWKLVKYQLRQPLKAVVTRDSSSLKTLLKTYIKDNKRKEEENGDPIINLLMKNGLVHPGGINYTLMEDLNDITTTFGFTNPEQMIEEAIKDSARGNGKTWKFVYNKLNLWRKQGIKSLQDLENLQDHQKKTVPFVTKQSKVVDKNKEILDKFRRGEA